MKMVYKDFLNAAHKHEYTCQVLLDKLERIDEKREKESFRFLILNFYYLSGYIIECIIKYGIYSLVDFPKDEDVKKLDKDNLTYKDHIKYHQFKRYEEYLNQRIGISLPLIRDKSGIDKKVLKLYHDWDAAIRYSCKMEVSEKIHYISFYQIARRILKEIRINVRG